MPPPDQPVHPGGDLRPAVGGERLRAGVRADAEQDPGLPQQRRQLAPALGEPVERLLVQHYGR